MNLEIPPKFKPVAALAALATLFLVGYPNVDRLLSSIDNSGEQSKQLETNKIQFIVLDEGSEPIKDVKVTFISTGSPVTRWTDSEGYVGINATQQEEVEIILSKEGFERVARTIDLSVDPGETLKLRMERLTP